MLALSQTQLATVWGDASETAGANSLTKRYKHFCTRERPFLYLQKPFYWPIRGTISRYICCCVRKWGAFLRLMRSRMLPFKRSIMGCAESGPSNAYFYSVSGGTGTTYSRGRANYRACSSGHHGENEVLRGKLSLFTYGIFFCVGLGVLPVSFLHCAQMPRTAGRLRFLHSQCEICNMKVKIGVSEKGPKYISGAAPIKVFLVFWCRASFSRKTVLPTSTKFR